MEEHLWIKVVSLSEKCSKDEYEFRDSIALEGDLLLGLGLDYDSEEDKCEDQMTSWLDSIKEDF